MANNMYKVIDKSQTKYELIKYLFYPCTPEVNYSNLEQQNTKGHRYGSIHNCSI